MSIFKPATKRSWKIAVRVGEFWVSVAEGWSLPAKIERKRRRSVKGVVSRAKK